MIFICKSKAWKIGIQSTKLLTILHEDASGERHLIKPFIRQFGRQIVHNFTQTWGVKTLYYFVLSNSTISCLYYVGVHIHSLFSDKKIVFGYKQTKRQNLVKKTVLT